MKYNKRIYLSISLTGLLLTMGACNDFLDEKSQDLYIPKTVQDYKEFLMGEGLNQGENNQISISEYLDMMTDDVSEVVNVRRKTGGDSREKVWGYYTWQEDPEIDFNNAILPDRSWDTYYHRILIANIIIDKMSEMTGSEAQKKDLEAEALFLRAWSYFMLANSYAQPYENEQQAEKTPAIPVNDATGVKNRKLPNAPLTTIYRLMQADLTAAVSLFEESKIDKTIFRPNLNATYLLLSRTALYTKQYDQAIKWASKLIQAGGKSLYDISRKTAGEKIQFIDRENTEILFSYGPSNGEQYRLYKYVSASNLEKGTFVVQPELIKSYSKDDKRKDVFFSGSLPRIKPFKYYQHVSKVLPYSFRLSEAYLNRAEAYAAKGETAKALEDMNTLRKHRISTGYEVTATNSEEAMNLVRSERRLELCFEGHRWFDLRRWGRPELTHKYSSNNNASDVKTYTLQKGDPRYTLPFPASERNR